MAFSDLICSFILQTTSETTDSVTGGEGDLTTDQYLLFWILVPLALIFLYVLWRQLWKRRRRK
ncbi:hypothetical protein [Robertkochia aurantiaca]|uniref:hypothetical protein n=1 Tax=Robertkochia aurantiaca TaxID=2873700 RepID=UPI001CC92717|nr:hypothetical protein [Robertkochia sp. 3YJGBD-33]